MKNLGIWIERNLDLIKGKKWDLFTRIPQIHEFMATVSRKLILVQAAHKAYTSWEQSFWKCRLISSYTIHERGKF